MSDLKAHLERKHGGKKEACCLESSGINSHEKLCKIRRREKLAAKSVNKILADKTKLGRHIASVHDKEKLLECKFCDHRDKRSETGRGQ